MLKSTKTFKDEFDVLYDHVPDALYADPNDASYIFFTSTLLNYLQEHKHAYMLDYAVRFDEPQRELFAQEESPWITPFQVNAFLQSLAENATDEVAFEEIFSQYFGFSAYRAYEYYSGGTKQVNLANAVTEFGKDTFGCYLPMHAFYRSSETPWGIYLFPELIIERASALFHEINEGLAWWEHLMFYWYAVYRHELFHYQVERFATRLEMLFNKPFYKPYQSTVSYQVQHSEDWLEEALAENAVLNSRLVFNRTRINARIFKKIYKYDLLSMPPGYRDYHCRKHGGPEAAIRKLSAQIANCTVEPTQKLTDLMTIKIEYGGKDTVVPGYSMINPEVKGRFQ